MDLAYEIQNPPSMVVDEVYLGEKQVIKTKKLSGLKSLSKCRKRKFIRIKDEFKERSSPQMFRKKWMEMPEFKDWLVEGMFPFQGYCTYCRVHISAGKSELLNHSKSKKHLSNADARQNTQLDAVTAIIDEFGETHLLRLIDLRSDSLSVPSSEMKTAMIETDAGDTAFGNDKSVTELEEFVANMMNKEAGLIFPTHVMANLAAVMAHCQARGSAVIVGEESDIRHSNGEALVKFGGLHLCFMEERDDGTMCLEKLEDLLKTLDLTFPLSCVVCIECAHARKGGRALPIEWISELGILSAAYGCNVHCDGTRLINASLAKNIPILQFANGCGSVTLALDKCLGAPTGAVLVGDKIFIERARYIRNFLGGQVHQAGMFAAAGSYALNYLLSSVDYDHEKAKAIAIAIARENNPVISVDFENTETNIVHLRCNASILTAHQLRDRLSSVSEDETPFCLNENIILLVSTVNSSKVSLMVHNKITRSDVKAITSKLLYVMREYSDSDNVK